MMFLVNKTLLLNNPLPAKPIAANLIVSMLKPFKFLKIKPK